MQTEITNIRLWIDGKGEGIFAKVKITSDLLIPYGGAEGTYITLSNGNKVLQTSSIWLHVYQSYSINQHLLCGYWTLVQY